MSEGERKRESFVNPDNWQGMRMSPPDFAGRPHDSNARCWLRFRVLLWRRARVPERWYTCHVEWCTMCASDVRSEWRRGKRADSDRGREEGERSMKRRERREGGKGEKETKTWNPNTTICVTTVASCAHVAWSGARAWASDMRGKWRGSKQAREHTKTEGETEEDI